MLRYLLLMAMTMGAAIDCGSTKGTSAPAVAVDARVGVIDRELALLGEHPSGSRAGALFEEKGDRLRGVGKVAEAKAAYLEAARAFNQSPEATNAPAIDSERCRTKAASIP